MRSSVKISQNLTYERVTLVKKNVFKISYICVRTLVQRIFLKFQIDVLRPFRMRIFDITDEMVSDKWLFGTYNCRERHYYCPLGSM